MSASDQALQAMDWRSVALHGNALIEASAGSGKTFTLVLLVIRQLLEREIAIEKILLSTFTEAATAELRSRIDERLQQALAWARHPSKPQPNESNDVLWVYLHERWQSVEVLQRDRLLLQRAARSIADMPIYTLHGFALTVLRSFALLDEQRCQHLLSDEDLNASAIDDLIRGLNVADFSNHVLAPGVCDDVIDDQWLSDLRTVLGRALKYQQIVALPGDRAAIADFVDARAGLLKETFVKQIEKFVGKHGVDLRAESRETVQLFLRAVMRALKTSQLRLRKRMLRGLADLRALKHAGTVLADNHVFNALRRFGTTALRFRRAVIAEVVHHYLPQVLQLRSLSESRQRGLSFNSMIAELARHLLDDGLDPYETRSKRALSEAIHARYPVALIDEFQDTDGVQFELLRTLYLGRGGLTLVGDPKQAIYRFRGSDVHAYLAAAQRFKHYFLLHNYRSTPVLLEGINRFYQLRNKPFGDLPITYHRALSGELESAVNAAASCFAGLHFHLIDLTLGAPSFAPNCLPLHHAALEMSQQILASESTTKNGSELTIAILVHTNRAAEQLQRLGRELNLPVAAVRGLLRIGSNRYWPLLRAALLALSLENDPRAWNAVLVKLNQTPGAEAADALAIRLQSAFQRGPLALLLKCAELRSALLFEVDRAERENELQALCVFVTRASQAIDAHSAAACLRAMEQCVHAQSVFQRSSAQFAPAQQATPTLYIMTVHAAKGLEFDYVLLPSLGDGLPDYEESAVVSADQTLYLDAGSEAYEASMNTERAENMAQAARLQYVALTRARQGAFVFLTAETGRKRDAMREHLQEIAGQALDDDRLQNSGDWQSGLELLSAGGTIRYSRVPLRDLRAAPDACAATELARAPAPYRSAIVRTPRQRLSFSALHRFAEQSAQEMATDADSELLQGDENRQLDENRAPHAALAALSELRGKGFGIVLHALMECDAVDEAMCARTLMEHGMVSDHSVDSQPSALPGQLHTLVQRIRAFPFAKSVSLAGLKPLQTASELGFAFNVRELALHRLQGCARAFGFPPLLSGLGGAQSAALNGQLIGFIDLIFEHEGKFYVLDYKTNWLGTNLSDYAGVDLVSAMETSGYHLQYLLYALALHRYLRAFLPGYQYAKHFGGVQYWFVRAFMADVNEADHYRQAHPATPALGVFSLLATDTHATLAQGKLSLQLLQELESTLVVGAG